MIELIPESYIAFGKAFARNAPVYVDLGCGDGTFLLAMAARHPERNFLGIERMRGRVETVCRKVANIDNVGVLHLENAYAVRYLLRPNSIQTFTSCFPIPGRNDDIRGAPNDRAAEDGSPLRCYPGGAATARTPYFQRLFLILLRLARSVASRFTGLRLHVGSPSGF
ncbi:MAG: hypothetical protein ACREIF_04245 [Chthoniobacterales bacterium]